MQNLGVVAGFLDNSLGRAEGSSKMKQQGETNPLVSGSKPTHTIRKRHTETSERAQDRNKLHYNQLPMLTDQVNIFS